MNLFDTTDHFYMPTSAGDTDWGEPFLEKISSGIIEVAGHPGFRQEWRMREREDLIRFAELARKKGHKLIGWHEL